MARPRKVVLPDGLIHIVVAVRNGQILDPIATVDSFDAESAMNSLYVMDDAPGDLQVTHFKVAVTPLGRQVVDA